MFGTMEKDTKLFLSWPGPLLIESGRGPSRAASAWTLDGPRKVGHDGGALPKMRPVFPHARLRWFPAFAEMTAEVLIVMARTFFD
jgi:hypothetical protein